eukprot:gnl/Dysnectes_brevis/821_a906_3671.p1 GENE.gnl/Dysnectes_brevis/821_a906_3671~~gnl/Dysnectes_brevis/821_a906_3671.p1  ORF type:complete len:717 (+),score=271.75 gnl/Dysnectes_brevis/821_a906_3671:39-2153(+)
MSLEKLIPIINQLQDVFSAIGTDKAAIDLPQIVVVGSQSAGKSSVLESVCHRDFLPRGNGIVTRRPLILQLHQLPQTAEGEWGEFSHIRDRKFDKFEDICQEIVDETDRVTGTNKGISSKPILLKLYSPNVVNLTLVDLPGITRNPIGDQPKDIEHQIKKCVLEFISKPNAIILAVTAANTDLATSDAIQLASQVDPEGKRTIGVLTKLDIMDQGTEKGAVSILNNEVHHLRLGWIGVVNRSQKDIEMNKPISKHLGDEEKFFKSSPFFRDIAHRQGVRVLTRRLNQILISHIQATLPDLRARCSDQLSKYVKELRGYGVAAEDQVSKERMLLGLLSRYERDYKDVIEGKAAGASRSELYGGARISYIFHQVLPKMLDTIDPADSLDYDDLRTLIRNSSGPRPSLFIPEAAFDTLVRKVVRRLEGPCRHCLSLVKSELVRIARHVPSPELRRYRRLATEVVNLTIKMINDLSGPTGQFIANSIRCELYYINTFHPDFCGSATLITGMSGAKDSQDEEGTDTADAPASAGALGGSTHRSSKSKRSSGDLGSLGAPKKKRDLPMRASKRDRDPTPDTPTRMDIVPDHIKAGGSFNDSERMAIDMIPRLLQSYYVVIRKKIQDTVPKAIMCFLIKSSKESLQEELVRGLYHTDRVDELLIEDETIIRKRRACVELIKMLRKANHILDSFSSIDPSRGDIGDGMYIEE